MCSKSARNKPLERPSKAPTRWRRKPIATLLGLVLVLGPGFGGCRVPVPFAKQLFFSRASLPAPQARDCERCHLEVYEEWSGSLHAHAWESEAFQRASAQGRAAECVGCHAPAPLEARGEIVARSLHREEGVTCSSCHLTPAEGARPLTMRGPVSRSSPVEVHPVFEEDPLYRSSELCGRCHQGALMEWQASRDPAPERSKRTCQECHMPEVVRRVESVHPEHPYSVIFVSLERKETLRRHLFAVPEDADRYVTITPLRAGNAARKGLRVRIDNDLPHALPTGRFGRRQVRLVAEWEGGRVEVPFDRALGEAIPARNSREITIPIPGAIERAALRIRLERWDHRRAEWTRLVVFAAEADVEGAGS